MKKTINKFRRWISEAGFTSTVYAVLFTVFFVGGHKFLSGAMLGIFVYLNWNVIRKLWSKPAESAE